MHGTTFEWIEAVVEGDLEQDFEEFCHSVAKEFGVTLAMVGPASGPIYDRNGTRTVIYRSTDRAALVKLICSDHGGGWDESEAGEYIYTLKVVK